MGGFWSGQTEYQQICTLPEGICLDRFIQTEIQAPRDAVKVPALSRIDAIAGILRGPSFRYDVAEVFKTGSLAQGTTLKGNLSDIDLVVYLNNHTVETITYDIDKILDDMHNALKRAHLPGYRCLSKDKFRLGIQLEAQGQTFEVDLLPGIKVSGSLEGMYKMMYNTENNFVQAHYSITFAKQQKDFISRRETKLKNLFQLIKYWSKVDLKSFGCNKVPSYLMSLIVIHTWEEYSKPQNFKTEIGFKAVLSTLVNYRQIQKVWFQNYDHQTWQLFGGASRPYLIDPANPSVNMLDRQNWNAIVQAAKNTLEAPFLKNINITSNWR